jgi:hypothetical protein
MPVLKYSHDFGEESAMEAGAEKGNCVSISG